MRLITEQTKHAFYNKGKLSKANTKVYFDEYDQKSRILLHNNCIATFDHLEKILSISNCGWFSNTTKERLNALQGVSIQQKNFVWYLNGKEWNGKSINIKNL
tara:strand:+ start:340 stop:645 length:306 start_codon:yes stop_codon:yes gene_type:complete